MKNFSFYLLLLKIGGKLLPLLKTLKVGKVALVGASGVAYSYLFTWEFALALVIMLLIHEYGHVWEMKRQGMKVKGMYLIPFIGAIAVPEDSFPNRRAESYSALMGPIWGGLFALFCYLVYLFTGHAMLGAIAGFMALINVFNLIPIMPLDGGRVFHSTVFSFNSKIGKWLLVLLFALGIVGAGFAGFWLLVFFGVLGLIETVFDILGKHNIDIPFMTSKEIKISLITYFFTIISLLSLMYVLKDIPEVELAMKILTDK